MNGSTDRTKRAIEWAKADYREIKRRIAESVSPLLVDGSAFSPSWRALTGGAEVWGMDDPDLIETYAEELDDLLSDEPVFWEEGCLWLEG